MAELDERLLKNLDNTLQSMNQRLLSLEKTLAGVRTGMTSAFDPSILQTWSSYIQSFQKLRLFRAEEASKDILKITEEIKFWQTELRKAKKEGDSFSFGFAQNELARLSQLMRDVNKGSEQRAIELANLESKEISAAQKINLAWTKAYDAEEKARIKARSKESRETYQKYFKQEEVKDANRRNQADRESLNIQRRQIQLKAEMAAIDKKRATEGKQLTSEEKARYREISSELTKLIARQKELDAISQGSGKRARGRLSKYEISETEKAMRRYGNAVQDARNKQQGLNNETNKMLPTIQRLASAFGIYFSVRGLAQFAKKLVETRGEFEMQFVAMKQIIGDVDAATKIWNQTMQQALQSPFKAMELVKYTKQLAAYRIETEKLYDTTKRLADISAGLGVDMQRLILAYGQVKAANFLRASEIRQFTEAGVNILGELASYFTEIRGQAYSTAQVMEMVTKRMVRFDDVEAIFKRMTDAGGIFFNMQEVQANTVKGQINKLHDAYDQMLNTIGQANQGTIRNFISLLIDLTKNWQKVGNTLKWVSGITVGLISYFKVAAIQSAVLSAAGNVNAITMRGLSGAIARYVVAAKAGETATRSFSAALASNPIGLVLVAFTSLVGILWAFSSRMKQAREEQEKFNEESREIRDKIAVVESYSDEIIKLSKEIENLNKVEDKSEEQEKRLKEAQEQRESLIKELSEENPKYANTIKDIKDNTEKLLEVEKEELAVLRATLVLRQQLSEKPTESTFAGLDEASSELEQANTSFRRNRIFLSDYIGTVNEAGEVNSEFFKNMQINSALSEEGLEKIKKAIKDFSSDKSWITFDERYNKFINEINQIQEQPSDKSNLKLFIQSFNSDFSDLLLESLNKVTSYYDDIKKANDKYNTSLNETRKKINEIIETQEAQDVYGAFGEKYAKAADEAGKENVRRDIISFWLNQLEEANLPKETRKVFEEELVKSLKGFGITSLTKGEIKQGFLPWQKRVNEAIGKVTEEFQNKRDELSEDAKKNLPEIDLYTVKDPFQTLEDAQQHWQKALKDVRNKIKAYEQNEPLGGVAISKDEYDALKLEEEELKRINIIYDIYEKIKGGGRQQNASKLISLIKEMRSEYDKLSKSAYGYAKSEEKVRDAYKDSVKEILGKAGITDYDFTTNEGMIAALEKVKSYATKLGKDAAAEVQKYIDQLETEIEINAQVRIREDFGKQMEKAFGDYELTLELDKLNISPEAAKDLFPEFDSKTLGELQDAMQAFYEKQGEAFDEEDLKAYKQWSDKIDSEILKSRKEKAKQYSKYLEKEYSDRAKLEMQYAKDVAFVTANFSGQQQKNILEGINDKFQKDISELNWKSFKESSFYVEMMDDLSSVPIEYMKLMLSKIEEILQNPEALPPRALKEAINARQKIIEAQMDFDQIAVMKESMAEIREAMQAPNEDGTGGVGGKNWIQTKKRLDEEQKAQAEKLKGLEEEIRCYEEIQGQLKGLEQHDEAVATANRALPEDVISMLENTDIDTLIKRYSDELDSISVSEEATTSAEKDANAQIQARIEYLQRIIPLLVDYRTALDERSAYQATDAGQNALFSREGGETSSSVGQTITEYKKEAEQVSNRLSTLKKWQKAFTNFNNSFSKFNKNAADMVGRLGALSTAAFDLYEALGGETDAMTEAWKDFGGTIVNTITQALEMIPALVAGFVTAGTTINAAMGIIGLIAEAIQLVLVLITGLSKLHDAGYEKEIENQQKIIDNLQRAYNRLEKEIEKTWDTASYIRTYNEETQNLYEQIEALNKQINAEESKKNADADKIQGYKDSIQDAEDELDELKQKQIEVFGGIGEEGYRDAAQGFVDAWKSAFLETGDGLQGLQEHFDEFLNDWFVKQATMRVAGRMLEPLFRQIDSAVDQYGSGGADVLIQELQNVREKFGILAPQLSDALEELAGMWGLGGEGSLSGLAAGIQGMTEEQANILEAYWNSVRGYTASIDMNVATIVSLLSNGSGGGGGGKGNIFGDPNVETNPMLKQLDLIAVNTAATHRILESVTKSGHSQGGYGIKVFAD